MTKLPGNAVIGVEPSFEPDERRREAFVAAYFETGNADKSSAMAGVHKNTGKKWKNEPWFDKAVKDLKRALDKQMDGRITKILSKALDTLEERIDKGDTKVLSTKDGIFREQVPVSARDLAVVTGVLFDKRNQLRREPENDDGNESALDRIAEKLRQYALVENKDPLRDTGVSDVNDYEDLV